MPTDAGGQITLWSIVSLLAGTIISSLVAYILQRQSFAEARRLRQIDRVDEKKAIAYTLTQEEKDWMAPRTYELNSLAQTMLQRTEHDADESRQLLQRLYALFVKEFGLSQKLEFKEP